MKPDELAEAGRVLYGERWQVPLARDLNVSDRTVRRWLAGAFAIPEEAEARLRAIMSERADRLGSIASRFDRERLVDVERLHGFMRGSVIIPPSTDLTEPVLAEDFVAQDGEIHR